MAEDEVKKHKYYVRVDDCGRIIYGLSDAQEQPQDGDILHDEQKGTHYQLRFADGSRSEENPNLKDAWRAFLYKLNGEFAECRTPEELEADRPPPDPPGPNTYEFALGLMGIAGEPEERKDGLTLRTSAIRGQETGALAFVALAQSGDLFDDVTIVENYDLFPVWGPQWTGKVGYIVRDPDDGQLYRKHSVDFATPYPSSQPSLDLSNWTLIGDPGEEWPEWSQPLGAHDAYTQGMKVTYQGKRYILEAPMSIYPPGVVPGEWREVN